MLKSIIFNIAFYTYTAFACTVLMFTFLLPRKLAYICVKVVYFQGIAWVERLFLGLDYHVEGYENLPKNGSYILALKHYSAYETIKLPVLFGDIAIILKRELTYIPLWGWYTLKLGMIPVDRGAGGKAIASLLGGAKRVIADNRPILIFPQGTRVSATDTAADKPYKIGTAKIAAALNLPVVPVALNSGAFWPKKSFLKKSGTVDFKILPPIPAGTPAPEILKQLEAALEPESNALMANAKIDNKRGVHWIVKLTFWLFILWAIWWHAASFLIERVTTTASPMVSSPYKPLITGFPGALHIEWPHVTIKQDNNTTIELPMLEALGLPLPGAHLSVSAPQGMRIDNGHTTTLDSATATIGLPILWQAREHWAISLKGVDIRLEDALLQGDGDGIDTPIFGAPINGTLDVRIINHRKILKTLVEGGFVKDKQANMARGILDAMAIAQGGQVAQPLIIRDDILYIGPLRLMSLRE